MGSTPTPGTIISSMFMRVFDVFMTNCSKIVVSKSASYEFIQMLLARFNPRRVVLFGDCDTSVSE